MFKNLIWRLGAGLVAAMLTASAAAIALLAAAFGVYAALRLAFIAPAAAGLTAVIFAALAGLIILAAPSIVLRRPRAPKRGGRARGETWAGTAEIVLAVLTVVADLAGGRRKAPRKEPRADTRETSPKEAKKRGARTGRPL